MGKLGEGRKTSLATLVTTTAVLATLALPAAGADELQADQQLLSSRIDEVAEGGLDPGAGYQYSVSENPAASRARS
jgi:hypothetical protein